MNMKQAHAYLTRFHPEAQKVVTVKEFTKDCGEFRVYTTDETLGKVVRRYELILGQIWFNGYVG